VRQLQHEVCNELRQTAVELETRI